MKLYRCLCCDSANLKLVIDLGDQVPANAFHDGSQPQQALPLRLMRCSACTHLQLDWLVDADALYRDYKYVTSISPPMWKHFDSLSERISGRVLEVGCNDGYLLKKLVAKGCEVIGVDPARNFTHADCVVIPEFWSLDLGLGRFDYIVATNVVAHMHDPRTALAGFRDSLLPGGVIIIEVHNAASVMVQGQFDTIYHEHVSYFTITSMETLAESVGLYINQVEFPTTHGGSLRFYLSATRNGTFWKDDPWVDDEVLFEEYPHRIHALGTKLKSFLRDDTVGFGASAKLVTAIQTFGLKLKAVVDETPDKQGKYIASTNIPVVGLEGLGRHILNGCWNYGDSVREKLRELAPGSILVNYFPEASSECL